MYVYIYICGVYNIVLRKFCVQHSFGYLSWSIMGVPYKLESIDIGYSLCLWLTEGEWKVAYSMMVTFICGCTIDSNLNYFRLQLVVQAKKHADSGLERFAEMVRAIFHLNKRNLILVSPWFGLDGTIRTSITVIHGPELLRDFDWIIQNWTVLSSPKP